MSIKNHFLAMGVILPLSDRPRIVNSASPMTAPNTRTPPRTGRVASFLSPDDAERPLQLLARTLEFTDPVTGVEHRFDSGRRLAAWASYGTLSTTASPADSRAPWKICRPPSRVSAPRPTSM